MTDVLKIGFMYFIYVDLFTCEFIADIKLLLVVCTKVGIVLLYWRAMTERLRLTMISLGVSKPGSGTASPIEMTT